jgi:hypothetical protein
VPRQQLWRTLGPPVAGVAGAPTESLKMRSRARM